MFEKFDFTKLPLKYALLNPSGESRKQWHHQTLVRRGRHGVSLVLLSHRFQDVMLICGLAISPCDPFVLMIKKCG
ncbi:unnamed protein product [Sphenostylis stenocarpa]|uniref:Uncharacterized protein n=1 Tax=Sphenostylis stenocarpa TaxID=92480 RepID=A0AA86T6F5_9FABA|nr:unnamed protein product [Sphenostylis stenocarpa]